MKSGTSITDEQVIEDLQKLGFSLNDARVYLALVQYGESTPAELAVRCEIDRARVYDSLKRLTSQHFIDQESTKNRPRYSAVDPVTVFQEVQQNLEEKLKITTKMQQELQNRFKKPLMPHEKYWNVEGEGKIKAIILSIINNAESKLNLIITHNLLLEGGIPWILKQVDQKMPTFRGKKIAIQLVLPISTLEQGPNFTRVLENLRKQGVEIFDFASKLMPFGLYINEKSFLFIPASEFGAIPLYESGIWIEDAKADKLLGFSHLADWFLRLTREGLLSPWPSKTGEATV